MDNAWKDLRQEGVPESDNATYKGRPGRPNRSGEQADSDRVGVRVEKPV